MILLKVMGQMRTVTERKTKKHSFNYKKAVSSGENMKIRTGFVSNSSSSSFVIGIKDVASYEGKMMSLLKEEFGKLSTEIYKNHLDLKKMGKVISVKEYEEDGLELETDVRFTTGWFGDIKKYRELEKEGYTFYCGSFSSDGEPLEGLLRDHFNFDIENDGLMLKADS